MAVTFTSRLSAATTPLNRQRWTVDLEASFRLVDPTPDLPDLCAALSSPRVTLLAGLSPNIPLGQIDVNYGEETIVQSEHLSELFLTGP